MKLVLVLALLLACSEAASPEGDAASGTVKLWGVRKNGKTHVKEKVDMEVPIDEDEPDPKPVETPEEKDRRIRFEKYLAERQKLSRHLPERKKNLFGTDRMRAYKVTINNSLPSERKEKIDNYLPAASIVATSVNSLPPQKSASDPTNKLPSPIAKKPEAIKIAPNVFEQQPGLGCHYCKLAVNAVAHAGPQPMMGWCVQTQGISAYLCQLMATSASHSFAKYTKNLYTRHEIWLASASFLAYGKEVCKNVCKNAAKAMLTPPSPYGFPPLSPQQAAAMMSPGLPASQGLGPGLQQSLQDPSRLNPQVQAFTYGPRAVPRYDPTIGTDPTQNPLGDEMMRRNYDEKYDRNLVAQPYGRLFLPFPSIEEAETPFNRKD